MLPRLAARRLLFSLLACSLLSPGVPAAGIPKFGLARGDLVWQGSAEPYRFINAVGERSGIWGYESGRLEAWVYPLKIFRDFHLTFQMEGWPVAHIGDDVVRSVRVYPHMVQLLYATEQFAVTQTIFAPRSEPGAVILLDVKTPAPLRILAKFRPELDLMWPAGIGGQGASWDEGKRWIRLSEAAGRFSALVGSPAAVASSAVGYNPYLTERHPYETLEIRVSPDEARSSLVPIIIAATIPEAYEAEATYERLLGSLPELHADALARFTELERDGTEFHTPDPTINRSLRWARVALEQLKICNPNVGCSYVSGYGSSGAGTRPMYAWFFDEPAIALWSMLAYGDKEGVKTAYRFIQKYSRDDGKVMHEVSQSEGYIDWFHDYPYAYIHPDSPIWNVIAMGHFYRFTGDEAFTRESWPFIRKAYDYMVSICDPSDGLPRIPEGEWGSMESARFSKDAAMAAGWIAMLRVVQEIAGFMGEEELVAEAKQRETEVTTSLEKFWNPELNYYNYGLDMEGNPVTHLSPVIGYSAWHGALARGRALAVLERLSNASFLTDWGQRNLSLEDPRYQEGSYQVGSVWPFMTAGPMLAQYRYRRPIPGFLTWISMNHLRSLNARGFMPEVLSGHVNRLLDRGVPHQMFSEHAIIPGLVNGILGLDLHVPRRTLRWAPQLPPQWPSVRLQRFPYGDEKVDLEVLNKLGELVATIAKSSPREIELEFAPALPAGSQVEAVLVDGQPVEFDRSENPMDVQVKVKLSVRQQTRVTLRYAPGVAVEVPWEPLLEGEDSKNLRVLRAKYSQGLLEMLIEGRPARNYQVLLHTPWKPYQIEGARVAAREAHLVTLSASAPASARQHTDRAGYARWSLRVNFKE